MKSSMRLTAGCTMALGIALSSAAQATSPETTARLHCQEQEAGLHSLNCSPTVETRQSKSTLHFLIPAYIMTQTGGYMGVATLGAGWEVGKGPLSFEVDLQAGYSPAFVTEESLFQLDSKLEWHPFGGNSIELPVGDRSIRIDPIYLALGLIYGMHKNLFVKVPSQYPEEGYYPPTARRLAPSLGLSATYGLNTVFLELTTLDVQIGALFRDSAYLDWDSFKSMGTWGAGYKLHFE
jgi:hypothetical protein